MNISTLSYRIKLIISFILFSFMLTSMTGFMYTFFVNSKIKVNSLKDAHLITSQKLLLFDQYTKNIQNKLNAIESSELFQDFLDSTDNKTSNKLVKELFLSIATTNGSIMQLRYLDSAGNEVIRVDRDNIDSTPYLISTEALQNKSNRYYFTSILNRPAKSVWFSKIDLNVEHDKIEIPTKPVLRVGIPVLKDSSRKGILIINVFMHDVLQRLISSESYAITLMDKNGDVLVSFDERFNWSAYFDKSLDLKSFGIEDKSILQKKSETTDDIYIESLDFDNTENISFVLQPRKESIDSMLIDEIKLILATLILVSILSIPLAYLVSKKPIALEKSLAEHNKYLETHIIEAVNKYEESQKMLIYQNRLALIGEMISMIAHQWRQPLNVISTTAGGLKIRISKDKLSTEKLEEKLEVIEKHTRSLSKTIDAFRNFYQPQDEKSEISTAQLIHSSLDIIDASIEDDHIKLETDLSVNPSINVYQRELQQAIVAILQNAREALLEKPEQNRSIRVKTTEDDEHVQIKISDNAGGIQTEDIQEIFLPYFSTKDKNGRGLGLYMAKTIIEDHCDGILEVHNNEEWAVFSISIKKRV